MLTHWLFWVIVLFAVIFIRYLVFSGLYHYILRVKWADRLRHRIFHAKPMAGPQVRREIYSSAVVSLIFAAFGILVLWLWQADYTLLYTDFTSWRCYWWLLAGPFVFLLAQETYYYWIPPLDAPTGRLRTRA